MFHLAKICNTVLEYGMEWTKGNEKKDTSKMCKCIFIRYNIRVLIAESERCQWGASDVDRHTPRSKSRHQLAMQRDCPLALALAKTDVWEGHAGQTQATSIRMQNPFGFHYLSDRKSVV